MADLLDTVVAAHGLRRCYDRVEAVVGIDLAVREGEIFAFVGPNGAGKSNLGH